MDRSAVAAMALLLASCSSGDDEADGNAAAPVALVTLGQVAQGALTARITLYGAAEPGPGGKLVLSAPAEANVIAIDAPVGTRVARGSVIARLAASPTTRVDLVKAASDVQAADAALARAIRLKGDGLVGNTEVETARAAAKTANATRAAMATRTGGLVLRATAPGIVTTVTAAPGDLVQAGTPIATITGTGDLRARFGVDPATARGLRPGEPLRIAASGGAAAFDVPIASIDPATDPQTRLASVFARIPAGTGIGAGQTLGATVSGGGSGSAALTIPYAALLDDAGQAYVYVAARGVAHRRDVTVGAASGDRVAVTGVKPGEQVVVAGATAVEDGMKVRTR